MAKKETTKKAAPKKETAKNKPVGRVRIAKKELLSFNHIKDGHKVYKHTLDGVEGYVYKFLFYTEKEFNELK